MLVFVRLTRHMLAEGTVDQNRCTLKVDSRKLSMVLHAYTFLNFNSIIMCMIREHSLVLHVLLEPASNGALTFYLPIVLLNDDEEEEVDPHQTQDDDDR